MRDKFIKIRVSDSELARIKEKAASVKMTVSRYLRSCAVEEKIVLYDISPVQVLRRSISGVCGNINQIATVANANKCVTAKDLEDLKEAYDEIDRKVSAYLTPVIAKEI